MKYLKLNLENPEKEVLEEIVAYLKKGKVVALPTDTIYGLSCLATSRAAIKKIATIKKRPIDKKQPFLVLVSSLKQAKSCVLINQQKNESWKKWRQANRPVTVILPSRGVLAKDLENLQGALGLRLPASDFLRKIIKLSGVPLVSTSFNLHGQKTFASMSEAQEFFNEKISKPDLIIDGGRPKSTKPSMLIDLSGEREVIIRK